MKLFQYFLWMHVSPAQPEWKMPADKCNHKWNAFAKKITGPKIRSAIPLTTVDGTSGYTESINRHSMQITYFSDYTGALAVTTPDCIEKFEKFCAPPHPT